MRISLPHMGNTYVLFHSLFRELGVEMVVPPPNSARTLSLGARYSPEFICIPFKLTLGNYIEALEMGADTLLMVSGLGPCRFAYYHKSQVKILEQLGHQFQVVTIELLGGITGVMKAFKGLAKDCSWMKFLRAVKFALAKISVLDELERRVLTIRAREKVKGMASQVWREAVEAVDQATDYAGLGRVKRTYLEKLAAIPLDEEADLVRVGIIGEFYVVLEPFVNMDTEVELGKLGVEVWRTMFVSEWTKFSLFLSALGISHKQEVFRAARPYLKRDVGGDGWESVGETVLHAQQGFDGMVHLAPFTCMPEIIAQNLLPAVIKDRDIPVLTIHCDEQMGKAGLVTRLEAFVDLLYRRRRHRRQRLATVR